MKFLCYHHKSNDTRMVIYKKKTHFFYINSINTPFYREVYFWIFDILPLTMKNGWICKLLHKAVYSWSLIINSVWTKKNIWKLFKKYLYLGWNPLISHYKQWRNLIRDKIRSFRLLFVNSLELFFKGYMFCWCQVWGFLFGFNIQWNKLIKTIIKSLLSL